MTADRLPPPFPDDEPAAATPPAPAPLRPLHLVEDLEWGPAKAAVIVFASGAEAQAAKPLLPGNVCVGWSGDRHDVNRYDWTPIAARPIFLFAGPTRAAADAQRSLLTLLPNAVQLPTPTDWTRPGLGVSLSVTTSGWTPAEAQAWLAMELQLLEDGYEELRRGRLTEDAAAEAALAAERANGPLAVEPNSGPFAGAPFRCLGYQDGRYYYLPGETQQITSLEPRHHVRANLAAMAPTGWWEQTFPGKPSADFSAATDALFRESEIVGFFNPSIIRGRGCWIDTPAAGPAGIDPKPRVVFHAGDQLIVNRTAYPLGRFPSKFVYQRGHPLAPESTEPLSSKDAAQFRRLCESFQWASPIYGTLLAGWCMAAAVCGALNWRPHIWITGPAGTGKSWVLENIVNRFLDRFALSILSSSTEAGMRQAIQSDAMPIVLDEAESEDEKARVRFKSILDLVRQSSSESGGAIIKGTMHGTAMQYRVRSCFCFASIGVAAVARADTSRITVLSLERRPDNALAFAEIKTLANATIFQSGYAAGLRARAINLALEIRENAKVFGQAVTSKVSDARTGDQLGALLAGAFALNSSKLVTLPEAAAWVAARDWSEFMPAEADLDETRALSILAQSLVRIETSKGPATVSIGELIQRYYRPDTGNDLRALDAEDLLRRGIKVAPQSIDISCSHPELAKIFRDTIWAGKWRNQLERIGGPKSGRASVRFGAAFNRAVRLSPTVFGCQPFELEV